MNLNEIDDLDDDLMQEEPSQQPEDNPSYEEHPYDDDYPEDNTVEEEPQEEEDVISAFLRSKGINPNSIKFTGEDGQQEEHKFEDLSAEEQLQILQYNELDDNYGLTNEETQLINNLRSNNLSVQDYNDYIAKQAIENYTKNNTQPQYQVDSISDDELFIIDLKARIPELSDEEVLAELDSAKANEDLFTKKVQSIRDDYKQKEDLIEQQEQQLRQQEAAQQAQQFEQLIINTIQENDSIDLGDSQLALSVDDKNEIASFILDEDATGVRYISRALDDPRTLVKMVWYALKGEEAFSKISDYYKSKISEAAKYNYNKGYEDAKSGKAANLAKSIVRKPAKSTNKPLTINDID